MARHARLDGGRWIVGRHPAVHGNFNHPPLAVILPGEGPPRLRIPKQHRLVTDQILRRQRLAVPPQITGSRARHDARFEELTRDERGRLRWTGVTPSVAPSYAERVACLVKSKLNMIGRVSMNDGRCSSLSK
jgi:hypothetical protein